MPALPTPFACCTSSKMESALMANNAETRPKSTTPLRASSRRCRSGRPGRSETTKLCEASELAASTST